MKKFLIKISLFSVLTVITAFLLDIVISYGYKNTTTFKGEFEVWQDIYQSKIDADIAIYGSSRAWVHISPQIIYDKIGKKVYNLGINGNFFLEMYLRHKKNLKFSKKPKYIIYSLDAETLIKRKKPYNYQQFIPYLLWDKEMIKFLKEEYGLLNLADCYLPMFRYRHVKNSYKYFYPMKLEKNRNNGYKGVERTWSYKDYKSLKTMKKRLVRRDKKVVELFEKFIQECKRENIKLIFVFAPLHKLGQDVYSNFSDIKTYYKRLSKKYDIPFLDYTTDPISFEKKWFYNSLHLNKSGAEKFSNKLADDLIQLNILN
ncbi:MAG: hypothetical protein KGV44_02815 [Flavobacteriaceae bacterium]|nr:hypothetical protein [Flavobacteriaceae bacterium]